MLAARVERPVFPIAAKTITGTMLLKLPVNISGEPTGIGNIIRSKISITFGKVKRKKPVSYRIEGDHGMKSGRIPVQNICAIQPH